MSPTMYPPLPSPPHSRSSSSVIGTYPVSVQELLIIDDLLSALVDIEGRYISIKSTRGHEGRAVFQIDNSMDFALQELTQQIFLLCTAYVLISHFVEDKSHFKSGLVNHAFATALRALLLDYQAMVTQLKHQFCRGRLSVQGLWFFCQPMLGSLNALSKVVEKASSNNYSGSATLNLLKSQTKAMSGDNAIRSLLEKMTMCASSPYLRILERWLFEGVIDDPYGEFFIAENSSLQKESLTQDYDAKYWQQRYSLNDPGNAAALTECKRLLDDSIDNLKAVLLLSHNFGDLQGRADDVRVWLNGVISYQQACTENIDDPTLKAAITNSVSMVVQFAINALAFVKEYAKVGEDLASAFNISFGSPSRRLLGASKEEFPSWFSAADRRFLRGGGGDGIGAGDGAGTDTSTGAPLQKLNVVVDLDGTGDFNSTNADVKAMPKNYTGRYIIYVKAGLYKKQGIAKPKVVANSGYAGCERAAGRGGAGSCESGCSLERYKG